MVQEQKRPNSSHTQNIKLSSCHFYGLLNHSMAATQQTSVCTCVCTCVYVYMCVCTCVCVTLLQSTQLLMGIWWPGVNWGSSPLSCNIKWVPGVTWRSKCPTVLVSLNGVEVIVELLVLQPLSVRPGQSSCGLLALLQEDLPAQGSSG